MKLSTILICLGVLIIWLASAILLLQDHISVREWFAIVLQLILGATLTGAGSSVYDNERKDLEKFFERKVF